MIKVNVISSLDTASNENFRYRGTYLHGVLEKEICFDIFCFDRPTAFAFGATKMIIESTGRRATFFLWEGDERFSPYIGYLVYDNDEQYEFCRKNFEQQVKMI